MQSPETPPPRRKTARRPSATATRAPAGKRDPQVVEPPARKDAAAAPEPELSFRPDETRIHLDTPAARDGLGRAPLAAAVAKRLRRLWAQANGRNSGPESALVVHVHGAWGAGKSTFLGFLRDRLTEETENAVTPPFAVVEFNAWRNQRVDPPWWFLLDAVYRQGRRSLPWWRRPWFFLRETAWRLGCGNGLALTTFLVAAAITLVLLARLNGLFGGSTTADGLLSLWTSGESAGVARAVTAVVSLVVTLAAGIKFALSSLFTGSARAAERMFQHVDDPSERFGRHFRSMLARLDRPVAVLIDNLDRCSSGYTVRLIEGIQTLFNDSRVIYVLAADRRWLECCFMCEYSQFKEHVQQPGNTLGHLFAEKLVQLFVALPQPTPERQQDYWARLLAARATDGSDTAEDAAEARRRMTGKTSQAEILQVVNEARDAGSGLKLALRAEAVERMADAGSDVEVEHFLMPLVGLLEPNPRSMKRLVNSYTIFRDVALLSDLPVEESDDRRRELARWAILAMEAPLLLDHIEGSRAKFDGFVAWDKAADDLPAALVPLRENDRIRRLFLSADGEPLLTWDTIRRFALLRG